MTLALAIALDAGILALARNPGPPFRKLELPLISYVMVGAAFLPICLVMASMLTGGV